MKLVILESPYAGKIERNVQYARRALVHSLYQDEAPIASHLLYTQEGVLDDGIQGERERGIRAGLAWRHAAQLSVFYCDYGWSPGMLQARKLCERESRPYEVRFIGENPL